MTELRNLRHDDLPYLPGLLAALDREAVPWDASWLERKIYGDPDYDPALSPVIEAAGRPVALVHGVVRGGGNVAFLKVMAVERAFRRQGFATRLLDVFEARARTAGATSIRILFALLLICCRGLTLLTQQRCASFSGAAIRQTGKVL